MRTLFFFMTIMTLLFSMTSAFARHKTSAACPAFQSQIDCSHAAVHQYQGKYAQCPRIEGARGEGTEGAGRGKPLDRGHIYYRMKDFMGDHS